MSKINPWERLLREALAALALPPGEQGRVTEPGCVTCELLEDFDHARLVALGQASDILSEEQRLLLDRINILMEGMQQADFECFNSAVLLRPVWQQLRELAAEALCQFGWEGTTIHPFVESELGVWRRPPSDR